MNLHPRTDATTPAASALTSAMPPVAAAQGAVRAYGADAFAYSLPGGFAKAVPWGVQHGDTASMTAQTATARDGKHTLIVTDVACDLPPDWLGAHDMTVLPVKLRFDSRSRSDTGDAAAALAFFRHDLSGLSSPVQTLPLSASGTQEFIAAQLRSDTDFVIEIALASHRGSSYMNSLTAAQNLMLQHGRTRRQAGVSRPFKMWVIDSTTALNGQAVLVAEGVRALHEGMSAQRVVQHLDLLRRHIHSLAVPGDASFFHRHNALNVEPALNWLSFGVGKMLDRMPIVHAHGSTLSVAAQARGPAMAVDRALAVVAQQVRSGLLAPCVCVSYAGDLDEVRRWPAFTDLDQHCNHHGIALHLGTMSMTNALTLGSGGLSVAFAAQSLSL